ncbi:MAG: class I SAM-dependent methyltransferase [Bacteroidota bacterium]
MEDFNREKHWNNIYQTKALNEVSWYQPNPNTSLGFVKQFNLAKTAKILDVGGGDSFFVDGLLDLGFVDITVLDISESALERAKIRLGTRANKVKWIVADIATVNLSEKFDFWHDRAAFHFLTIEKEIEHYVEMTNLKVNPNGFLVIGTFSENGPRKCSGLEIKQYTEATLVETFKDCYRLESSIIEDHKTPFDTVQNFVFCSFSKFI